MIPTEAKIVDAATQEAFIGGEGYANRQKIGLLDGSRWKERGMDSEKWKGLTDEGRGYTVCAEFIMLGDLRIAVVVPSVAALSTHNITEIQEIVAAKMARVGRTPLFV